RFELGVPGSPCERPHLAAVASGRAGEVGTVVKGLVFLVVRRLPSGLSHLVGLAPFLVASLMPLGLHLAPRLPGVRGGLLRPGAPWTTSRPPTARAHGCKLGGPVRPAPGGAHGSATR